MWVGEKQLVELVRMSSAPIAAGAEVGTAAAAVVPLRCGMHGRMLCGSMRAASVPL